MGYFITLLDLIIGCDHPDFKVDSLKLLFKDDYLLS